MVSRYSAIAELHKNINHHSQIPIQYDHSEMVKFTSGSDENYIITKNLLKQFLKQAPTVIRNRFSDLGGGGVHNDNVDNDKFEALSKASAKSQWSVVELLLKGGFKQNDMNKASYNVLQNEFSGSILHHAASNGYEAMVRLCLDNREEISSKDCNGWRALHFAAEGDHEAASSSFSTMPPTKKPEPTTDQQHCTLLPQAAMTPPSGSSSNTTAQIGRPETTMGRRHCTLLLQAAMTPPSGSSSNTAAQIGRPETMTDRQHCRLLPQVDMTPPSGSSSNTAAQIRRPETTTSRQHCTLRHLKDRTLPSSSWSEILE